MRHAFAFGTAAACAAALLAGSAAAAVKSQASTAPITAAVADKNRPADDVKLDEARKPAEMLAFAGVKPGMVVIDFWPGGGYFTRLFSHAVGPKGVVYAITPDKLAGRKGAVERVAQLNFDPATPNAKSSFENVDKLSVPQQADIVWTAQNYHDLHDKFMNPEGNPTDVAAVNKAIFNALKPGGVFIVLDHVAQSGSGLRDTDTLHRIDPETVKKEVEAAGFEFVGEDKVLANPADPHDKTVFDDTIRHHTDQFIYKFRKPAH